MRIQSKMLLISLILILLLLAGTFAVFHSTNLDQSIARTRSELQLLSDKLALQLELLIQQNEIASLFMLSDSSLLTAINNNMMPGRWNAENRIIVSDSANKIRQTLRSYAVLKHLHSVIAFNRSGDVFTSDYQAPLPAPSKVKELLKGFHWMEEAEQAHGRLILLDPYLNPFAQGQDEWVYGTVRAITTPSGETLFMLIQRDVAELDELFNLSGIERTRAKVLRASGETLYAFSTNDESASAVLDVRSTANRYGLQVQLHQDLAATYGRAQTQVRQLLAFSLAVMLVSLVYLYLTTRRLTKPLRKLQDTIEHTALHNLGRDMVSLQGNEFKALALAFQDLMSRLKTAVEEKVLAGELETQARMDALQAQVNPHFLYNSLTLLTNHAMKTGDTEALDICENIVSMLRYSTSISSRQSTVGEEVAHVHAYLDLMGKRYQHRLVFHIEVSENLMDCLLPKIVLQPLAENALKHGYSRQGGQMSIQIQGYQEGDEGILVVKDNGSGFDEQTLQALNTSFKAMTCQVKPTPQQIPGGGLGLVNTCMRLKMFFDQPCSLGLTNTHPGAVVTIRFPIT